EPPHRGEREGGRVLSCEERRGSRLAPNLPRRPAAPLRPLGQGRRPGRGNGRNRTARARLRGLTPLRGQRNPICPGLAIPPSQTRVDRRAGTGVVPLIHSNSNSSFPMSAEARLAELGIVLP